MVTARKEDVSFYKIGGVERGKEKMYSFCPYPVEQNEYDGHYSYKRKDYSGFAIIVSFRIETVKRFLQIGIVSPGHKATDEKHQTNQYSNRFIIFHDYF